VSHAKGKSDLPEAKSRWLCSECGHICYDEYILTAPSPFDPSDNITGCPHCKAVDSFGGACAADGCRLEASGGHPGAFGFRYVWTCWDHSPSNPSHKVPEIATQSEEG
jgi:hypothetical protein